MQKGSKIEEIVKKGNFYEVNHTTTEFFHEIR